MTFASIATALTLATLLALAIGWTLARVGTSRWLAAQCSLTLALFVGVATLLSDSPAGLVRAVWPREAVDWLAIAAALLTAAAALQTRPVAIGRTTLLMGVLLGVLIVCRLLYGSIYLRLGNTSTQSLLAIALGGAVIGLCWHIELARTAERSRLESLACIVVGLGSAATLGMSGSFQYAIIGVLIVLASIAGWFSTRSWPWVGNLIVLMLLGLGMAFAELNWLSLLGLSSATFMCSLIGLRPGLRHAPDNSLDTPTSRVSRPKILGITAVVSLVALCVGLNAQRFLQAVKGNNASHGGYEAYK